MDEKDIVPFLGVIASLLGGIVWLWKKLVKPIINFVKRLEKLEEKLIILEGTPKSVSYINKKTDVMIYLSSDPLFLCNSDGLCILANNAICELFGASENQMKGVGWMNFLHPDDREKAWYMWKTAIENGSSDIKSYYRIIHGETEEEVEAICHAIIARDDENAVLISIGKISNK